ncbi:hypothetical protein L6R53_22615 [Myxococcota bacterium]|nr:hypothetical protein [Myxococcota bacterium]
MSPLSPAWLPLLALAAPSLAADPSPEALVTVQGQARDANGGAVVLTAAGESIYLPGLEGWPPAIEGRTIRATGRRTQARLLPEAEVGPDGAISQGVAPGSGPQEVLQVSTWQLAPDPSLVPPAPWALRWVDGNGNVARAWQDSPDAVARLSWHPVRPETSSGGLYSGGEPRLDPLDAAGVSELWALARTVQWAAPRAETRMIGTGLLTLSGPAGEVQALVVPGPTTGALEVWLAGG